MLVVYYSREKCGGWFSGLIYEFCSVHFPLSWMTAVQRLLDADEDPSEVVDFWGKSRVGLLTSILCCIAPPPTPQPPVHGIILTCFPHRTKCGLFSDRH